MKRFLIIIIFFSITCPAQQLLNEQTVYFEHIYLPGSLRFNPINDIAQDSVGFMWFASDNGIFRYDGYNFESSNSFEELESYHEQDINSVVATSDNYIYFSLEKSATIIKMLNDFSEVEIFRDLGEEFFISQLIYLDKQVGFLGNDGILRVLNEDEGTISTIDLKSYVTSVCQDGNSLYAGTNEGIYLLNDNNKNEFLKLSTLEEPISSVQVINGDIIFATTKAIYQGAKVPIELYSQENFDGNAIKKVYQTTSKDVWVLTENSGLYLVKEDGRIIHFKKNYFIRGAISNNKLIDIYEDESGIIWVATAAGINKYDSRKRHFSLLTNDPSDNNSICGNMVRGLFETSDERIFVALDEGFINIIDSSRTTIDCLPVIMEDGQEAIPYSFLEKEPGQYYVGTSLGLTLLDMKSRTFKILQQPRHPQSRVRDMLYLDEYTILGLSYGWIWLFDTKNEDLEFLNIEAGKHLFTGQGRAFLLDDDRNLFIGGVGEIAYIDLQNQTIKKEEIISITSHQDTIYHTILSLHKYKDEIWVGTFNGGLRIFRFENGEFSEQKVLNKNDGLPDNTVYSAIKDKNDNFWLSTNNGISRFNPSSMSFFNYDRTNGLQSEEFNRLAFLKTKRGEIVMGGVEGLNLFFPENAYKPSVEKPKPIIVSVDIINMFRENGNGKVNPTYSLLNIDQLELDYDENYLRFNFTSNNFSQPEKSSFLYKLENYDNGWIKTRDPKASYTGLNPGKYIFQLKTIDENGNTSEAIASVPITIEVVWWRTWWILILAVALIAAFLVMSFQRSMRKNMAIKRMLELEIDRRTKELKDSKEELARLNERKDFIFSILSHDLRSPLTTLKGFLGILIDHFHTLNEKEVKLHAINIKNSVAKSLDLLDNTLYWSLSQMGEITCKPVEVSVKSMFEKLNGLYDLTAQKKKIQLHFEIEEEINVYADDNMVYIILRNLVSNALKFTPAGNNIMIKGTFDENNAYIIVEDEGIGIRKEDLPRIFSDNFHHIGKGTGNEKGTGLGLQLCRKFTEMNHGRIFVDSMENQGSRFTVVLPLYQSEDERLLKKLDTIRNDSNPEQ